MSKVGIVLLFPRKMLCINFDKNWAIITQTHLKTHPETDVMILKIFSPKNLAKKLAFLFKLLLVFWQKYDHNIGY
jgi:hypothetical protein